MKFALALVSVEVISAELAACHPRFVLRFVGSVQRLVGPVSASSSFVLCSVGMIHGFAPGCCLHHCFHHSF